MRIFGIDPGSERTGYGCVETDGRRHRLVTCGAITAAAGDDPFPQRLARIHRELSALLADVPARLRRHREPVSRRQRPQRAEARARARRRHAGGRRGRVPGRRVHARRSQARGRRLRPRREASGAADDQAAARPGDSRPSPHDAADALAVAICHLHSVPPSRREGRPLDGPPKRASRPLERRRRMPRTWRAVPSSRQRMIAFLRGRVLDKQPNRVIVDVQGVGYEVHVPLSTFYDVGEAGAEVALRIYTHVREDALQLYGFLTDARAAAVRAADRHQRHRAEAGDRRAVGHRAARAGRRRAARRRRAADRHSRASARRPPSASCSS